MNISLNRIMNLIQIELTNNWGAILKVGSLLTILLTLFSIFGANQIYRPMLFIIGGITTINAFALFNNHKLSMQYVLTPCSTVEKLFAKWFVTAILLSIGLFFISILAKIFSQSVFYLLTHEVGVYNANLGLGFLLSTIKEYLVIHAIILFGAIYFRRNVLMKTILLCIFSLIAYYSLLGFIAWLSCIGCEANQLQQNYLKIFQYGTYPMFYLTPITFWFASYYRLKHFEAY